MKIQNKMFEEIKNKKVMIRTYSAGVHFGTLENVQEPRDGYIPVKLTNSKRIYSWTGAFTLSELAVKGSSRRDSKISIEVPSIYLNAIEIIEMTKEGYENLNSIPNFKPKD